MTIDIDRKFPLTKFSNKIGQKSVKVSDHNTLMLELNIRWNSGDMKEMRQEIFNFNNEENFKRFEMLTESNDDLIQCFDKCDDLNLAANRWLKMVNNMIKKSFKKVRIKKQKINPELETLFAEKENIRIKISQLENEENADKVLDEMIRLDDLYEDTVDKIATICADKNRALVDEYLGRTEDTIEGFKQVKTWSLKKKLAPKNTIDPPSAKRNSEGKLVTNKSELENLYLETYVKRLTPNPVKKELVEIVKLRELLFEMRIEDSKHEVTLEWTMDDLEKVLKSLKNNKARDSHGHIYELYSRGGQDLKVSLLKLFNLVKEKQIYPDIFLPSNISSFWKSKGRKDDLVNDRGVFNVVKIRTILDKLVLNDKYDVIDRSMSCSNI